MRKELGPLELFNGRWIIGDPEGQHITLGELGLEQWTGGSRVLEIPWSRFMEFGLEVQPGKLASSKRLVTLARIMALLGGSGFAGSGGARVGATLRHPYEYWSADFDHHARKYSRHEIALVRDFLHEVVQRGQAARLGDAEGLSTALQKLSLIPPGGASSRRSGIANILDSPS